MKAKANKKLWVMNGAIRKTIDPNVKAIEIWLADGLYDPERKDMSSVMRKCRLALWNQEYYVVDGGDARIACSAIEDEELIWYVFRGSYAGSEPIFLVKDVSRTKSLENGKWLPTKRMGRTIYDKAKRAAR